jgi:hypothetical protein
MTGAPTFDQVKALNEHSRNLRDRSLIARLNARELLKRIARAERERAAVRDGRGDSPEEAVEQPVTSVQR